MKPLNGEKTHPLKPAAIQALKLLHQSGSKPAQEFNPGVCNRLAREGLVRGVMLPSPYKSHKGACITHLEITEDGVSALKQTSEE
jgi:hypothetical protein